MPTSGLRAKPKNTLRIVATIAAVLWAGLIFGLSSIPGSGFPPHPDILNSAAHFGLYAVLAVLVTLALSSPRRALWKTAIIALVICSAYGASDELHQLFTGGRNCDVMDWLVDTIAALIFSWATIWYLSARKVKASRAKDSKNITRKD